jgi:very-long-chain (3R)-3-hydroxyacyl-CoA dehydratase
MSGKAAPPAAKSDKKEGGSSLVSLYLILYNLFSALGWAYLWLLIGQHFAAHGWEKGVPTLYAAIEQPLKLVQTAALLEIVHAMLRFVKSSPVITAIQGEARGREGGQVERNG